MNVFKPFPKATATAREAASAERFRPSKGIGLTNWMVSRASGLLERKTSRRGFLIGSAMAGSAVVVTGCQVATQPGSPYVHITDCGPSFCTDGWTEFCCAINGFNGCPPGSFAGGWWRAGLLQLLQRHAVLHRLHGALLRSRVEQQVLRGLHGVPVRGGLRHPSHLLQLLPLRPVPHRDRAERPDRVPCRHVRAARTRPTRRASTRPRSTTGPPSTRRTACSTSSPASPAATAATAATAARRGRAALELRGCGSCVRRSTSRRGARVRRYRRYTRTLVNGAWTPWLPIGGQISSGLAAVAAARTTDYVVARGADNAVWVNRRVAMQWSGWQSLGGGSRSDPAAVADGGGVQIFVRGNDDTVYANRYDGSSSTGWVRSDGAVTSEPIAVRDGSGIRVLAARPRRRVFRRTGTRAGCWSGWTSLGGVGNFESRRASPNGSGMYVFVRGTDSADLGATVQRVDMVGLAVARRSSDLRSHRGRRPLWGACVRAWPRQRHLPELPGRKHMVRLALPRGGVTADPVAVADSSGTYVFVRGNDGGLYYGQVVGDAWSGWQSLSGFMVPVRPGAEDAVPRGVQGSDCRWRTPMSSISSERMLELPVRPVPALPGGGRSHRAARDPAVAAGRGHRRRVRPRRGVLPGS